MSKNNLQRANKLSLTIGKAAVLRSCLLLIVIASQTHDLAIRRACGQDNWYRFGGIPTKVSERKDSKGRTLLLVKEVTGRSNTIRGLYDSRSGEKILLQPNHTVITKIAGKKNQGSKALVELLRKSTSFDIKVLRLQNGKSVPESARSVIVTTTNACPQQSEIEIEYWKAIYNYRRLVDCFKATMEPVAKKLSGNDRWDLVSEAKLDEFCRGVKLTRQLRSKLTDQVAELKSDLIVAELEAVINKEIDLSKARKMHQYLEDQLITFQRRDVWFHKSMERYEKRKEEVRARKIQENDDLIAEIEQGIRENEMILLERNQRWDQLMRDAEWAILVEEAEIAEYNRAVEEHNRWLESQNQFQSETNYGAGFDNSKAHNWNQRLFFNRGYSTNRDHRAAAFGR